LALPGRCLAQRNLVRRPFNIVRPLSPATKEQRQSGLKDLTKAVLPDNFTLQAV